MKLVGYSSWMLLCLCLLGLLTCGEANQAETLRSFLKSRLSRKPSSAHSLAWLHKKRGNFPNHIQPQDGSMEADKIGALPGQPNAVDFNHYSGYVTVDSQAGRALFYYFAESPENSSTNPLVLWLNGGPGCSSLTGAMTELGPFRVNNDGKTLFRNNYAWNNVANVIFLESPAGVGFYITGESYAGHYVPLLAYTILLNNKNSNQTMINLKGIAVGNGWIDDPTGYLGHFDYLWTHALNSDETNKGIHTYCHYFNEKDPKQCVDFIYKAYDEAGDIDGYTSSSFPWTDSPATVLPIIKKLMASGLRVWLYSGDVDAAVPITSTRYGLNILKLPIKTAWRPWSNNKEVKRKGKYQQFVL